MKVLSIVQPWASLIILDHKKIETRSFKTKYRGELLIHASLGKQGIKAMDSEMWDLFHQLGVNYDTLPYGKILGKVNLVDVIPSHTILQNMDLYQADGKATKNEKMFGDYSPNRYG